MKHISKIQMADILTIFIIFTFLVMVSVLIYYNKFAQENMLPAVSFLVILILLIQIFAIRDELEKLLRDK